MPFKRLAKYFKGQVHLEWTLEDMQKNPNKYVKVCTKTPTEALRLRDVYYSMPLDTLVELRDVVELLPPEVLVEFGRNNVEPHNVRILTALEIVGATEKTHPKMHTYFNDEKRRAL